MSIVPAWATVRRAQLIENLVVGPDGVIFMGCATKRPSTWLAGQFCPAG
jgi:hypothetical protein